MSFRTSSMTLSTIMYRLARYNLKIIFANKFIYFLMSSILIFLLVVGINLMSADAHPTDADVFWLLLVPGLLLIFYPITFGIQNDLDSKMLEVLFGVPNYRYKVWLLRLLLIFFFATGMLLLLSAFSAFALTIFPVLYMTAQLIFPIVFFGCLTFMISTIVRNGSGAAVVIVVIGLIMLIARDFFQGHPALDMFLNPFDIPRNLNESVWSDIVLENRIYLTTGSIAAILAGLLNLQHREKFL